MWCMWKKQTIIINKNGNRWRCSDQVIHLNEQQKRSQNWHLRNTTSNPRNINLSVYIYKLFPINSIILEPFVSESIEATMQSKMFTVLKSFDKSKNILKTSLYYH